MNAAQWSLVLAIVALVYISILTVRLVVAIWNGRAPRTTRASFAVAAVLIMMSVASLASPGEDQTLVAGVTNVAAKAKDARPDAVGDVRVSGNHVRIEGSTPLDERGIWAVIEDPRTGALWLQGPAQRGPDGWSLDLVVGPSAAPTDRPLPYRLSIATVHPSVNDAWAEAAAAGIVVLATTPPGQTWLARDRVVTIGS